MALPNVITFVTKFIYAFAAVALVFATVPPLAFGHQKADVPSKKKTITFKKDVKPILTKYCVKCHGGERSAAEIDLSNPKKLLTIQKGDTPLISPGQPEESLLIWAVMGSHNAEKMPFGDAPKGKNGKPEPFGEAQTKVLSSWISQGAKVK